MTGAQAAWLPDGRRLHLHHGPIDLIVEAFGTAVARQAAYAAAAKRFDTILEELVGELDELRRPASNRPRSFAGPVARRMEVAVCRHAAGFITPMAAVAGSVADEIVQAMLDGSAAEEPIQRAYVNNGGDIALHLGPRQSMRLAIGGLGRGFVDRIRIDSRTPVRGIATSGWRGRSFSLGIADAVTVLAETGAAADAAATLIGNAVDLPGHPAIARRPACELAPDSDLGRRLVTQGVGALEPGEIREALERGLAVADAMRGERKIVAAALFLGGESRVSGEFAELSGDCAELPGETLSAPARPPENHSDARPRP